VGCKKITENQKELHAENLDSSMFFSKESYVYIFFFIRSKSFLIFSSFLLIIADRHDDKSVISTILHQSEFIIILKSIIKNFLSSSAL